MSAIDCRSTMTLEPHGPHAYIAADPVFVGGRYGGQVVAQALRAASLPIDTTFRFHSRHAYFMRRGSSSPRSTVARSHCGMAGTDERHILTRTFRGING